MSHIFDPIANENVHYKRNGLEYNFKAHLICNIDEYFIWYNMLYPGTLVRSESGTVVVNSEAGTLVESELGTMVINEDSEDDDSTMKREYTYCTVMYVINEDSEDDDSTMKREYTYCTVMYVQCTVRYLQLCIGRLWKGLDQEFTDM